MKKQFNDFLIGKHDYIILYVIMAYSIHDL